MMKRRSSTRLRNKKRQSEALVRLSEKTSIHGRKLMPSKRMMDDKVPAARENVPSQMSSIATAAHRNQEKKEKRKRKKSRVTRRLYVDASSNSLGNTSQASSTTYNDCSIDLDQLVCFTCKSSHDHSDQEMYPISDPLFDPSNAVLLCDAPNCRAKAYHQRCHFVPVFSIPRGPWICLLCQYEESLERRGTKKSQQVGMQEAPQRKVLGPIIHDDSEFLNKFDREAAYLKAEAISEELSRLTKSLEHSMSNIRSAEHTITFYTNTERLRKELVSSFPRISSEFVHAKIKYSHNKFKVRQQLLSLQHYISELPPRPEPRFDVEKNIQTDAEPSSDAHDKTESSRSCATNTLCCVCYGESMPQNNIFLCGGINCKRAFHMDCLRPKLTLYDFTNHRKDWLCPFCSKLSELVLYVQQAHCGGHGYDVSWERADHVFPEARMEYQAALLLKERKAPIEVLFGESLELMACIDDNALSRVSDADDGDEDFCSDDSDEISSGDESASSNGSSLPMTERGRQERAKGELAYLSGAEDVSTVSEFEESSTSKSTVFGRRKKRKTRICQTTTENVSNGLQKTFQKGNFEDAGEFDLRNIVQGKRKRSVVDYKKLNADLFGDSIDVQSENTTDNDANESGNYHLPDDGDSESYTSSSSADTVKGRPDMSFKGLDRTTKCDKSLKAAEPSRERSSRSMRKKPLVNYRVLAGVIPSEDGSEKSDQVRECVQKRKREEVKEVKNRRESKSKKPKKDDYAALQEVNDSETGKKFAKRVPKNMRLDKSKQEFKEKSKSFCTCKRSKCLKLYCICFSNERLCIDGLCKCHDCGNLTAPRANEARNTSAQDTDAVQCPPHEILLALKMEEPVDEVPCTKIPLQQSTSSTVADDLPGLLLSLKATDNPLQGMCSPQNDTLCMVTSSSELAIESTRILTALYPAASANVPEPKFGSSSPDASKTTPIKNELALRCSCRKSSCLKLYCYCYSQGSFCNQECECRRCLNKPSSPLEAINHELLTDEQVKLPTEPQTMSTEDSSEMPLLKGDSMLLGRKHGAVLKTLGCSCRRSKCVKLYCVCYYNKIKCSSKCSCNDCANGPAVSLNRKDSE